MKDTSEEFHFLGKILKIITIGLIAFFLIYLAGIAVILKVNYYDTYDIYLSSRLLAGGEGFFCWERPVFLPIFLSPIFFMEKYIHSSNFSMIATRLVAVLFFAFLLWISYKFLRLYFEKIIALSVVLLIASNRVFIHYAPFVKEDIPASCLLIAGFYYYLRIFSKPKRKYFLYSCIFLTCAILTRYYFVLLVPILFVLYEGLLCIPRLFSKQKKPPLSLKAYLKKFVIFIMIPLLLFVLIPSVYYYASGAALLREAPGKFFFDLSNLAGVGLEKENSYQNYTFLVLAMTWPVCILALFGLLICFKSRKQLCLFSLLWFLIFFITQTYIAGHKEARYLSVLFFPIYFCCAFGLERILVFLRQVFRKFKKVQRLQGIVIGVLFVGIFYLPVRDGLMECLRFRDPVYSTDFQYRVGEYTRGLAKEDSRIFWLGTLHTLYPENYIFHEEDEYFYIYHFFKKGVKFLTGKMPLELNEKIHIYARRPSMGIFAEEMFDTVKDGDVVIVNPEEFRYETKSVPLDKKRPLIIEKVKRLDFLPLGESDSKKNIFKPSNNELAIVRITDEAPEGFNLIGAGIPLNQAELYVTYDGLKQAVFSDIPIVNGRLKTAVPRDHYRKITMISVIGFSDIKVFYAPKALNPQ